MEQKTVPKKEEPKGSNRFQEPSWESDITLVVEGQKLYVSKNFLMLQSTVFRKMFTTDFREKNLEQIELPGKRYSAMVGLLEQIYPGNAIDLIKDETMVELLELADEYDMEQVFYNCQQYIGKQLYECQSTMTTERIVLYLWLVEKYERLRSYRQELVYRASRIKALEISSSQHYLSVPATATRDVFLLRIAMAESFPSNPVSSLTQIEQNTWRQKMNQLL